MQRSAGILLPISSLPSPYGIGCFSQEAYDFVDWLKEAGQTYWQILPLGVTSYGDSPYQSFSAFAGNPYFISLDALVEEGVLTADECKKANFGRKADDINYSRLYTERGRLLRLAYSRSDIGHNEAFTAFCEKNKWWLDDFALFMAVKDRVSRARVDAVFASLDHEPEKLAQGAARALAAISGCTAAISTPCAEDLCIAHYEGVQVGRSAAAVLAVTTAGYVRTRVARVRTGLSRENAAALAALLNRNLTFVAPVDLSPRLLAELCSQIDPELVPVISAAAAILQDSVKPHVFLGGEQYLLDWPQLDGKVGDILTLLNDEEQAAALIAPPTDRSESVLLGEDLEPQIPGLCIVSDRYLVGGGLWGSIALIGPTRMPFQKLMPLLHYFADQLGEGMSGKRKDTPQAAVPRRTVIYKEDLE